MDQVTIDRDAWDGLRGLGNGIKRLTDELQNQLAGRSPHSVAEIAAVLDLAAELLNEDLDGMSLAWATEYSAQHRAASPDRKRRSNSKDLLASSGRVREGMEIVVDPVRLPPGADTDSDIFRAQVGKQGKKVIWRGEKWALSPLTVHLRDEYNVSVNQGNVNGFKYWCLASDTSRTLWDLAEEMQ